LVIAAKKPGAIVNISSIAGSSAIGRGNFAYSVAKGGVNQMTRELAIEWAKSKIRVNAIQPCSVNTPGWRKWVETEGEKAKPLMELLVRGIPMGRVAEPEDIAHAIIGDYVVPVSKLNPFEQSSAIKVEYALRAVLDSGVLPECVSVNESLSS
jgi:NAD(P)-dependent dehydrogenase (short-subunit alcohol dehydrogenase family)